MRAQAPIIAANVSAERESSIISFPFVFNSFYCTFFLSFRRAFLTVDRLEALLLSKEMRLDEVNALNGATFRSMKRLSVKYFRNGCPSIACVEIRRNRCITIIGIRCFNKLREYGIICKNMNVSVYVYVCLYLCKSNILDIYIYNINIYIFYYNIIYI